MLWEFNTMRPEQNGQRFADDIWNVFLWMKNFIYCLKFHIFSQISLKSVPEGPTDNVSALVQVMSRWQAIIWIMSCNAIWWPITCFIHQINILQKNMCLITIQHALIHSQYLSICYCPACQTSLIATRFWVVMICPIIKCLTVLEFSFILFDLCLFITIFNFILNYVPVVTFWILTYHKIWILLIIFCFIWSYWIIYFLTCLEVFWSVLS